MIFPEGSENNKQDSLKVCSARACLKKHSCNLHAPLCGIFCPDSVVVARYDALIRTKSPTNCDAHLAESLFQTRSKTPKRICLLTQILLNTVGSCKAAADRIRNSGYRLTHSYGIARPISMNSLMQA